MGKLKVSRVVCGNDDFKKQFKNWETDLGVIPPINKNVAIVGTIPVPEGYDPEKVYNAVKAGGINNTSIQFRNNGEKKRGRPPKKVIEDTDSVDTGTDADELSEVDDSFF